MPTRTLPPNHTPNPARCELDRRHLLLGGLAGLLSAGGQAAWPSRAYAVTPKVARGRLIEELVWSGGELTELHDRSKPATCDLLPAGVPLELSGYVPYLTSYEQDQDPKGQCDPAIRRPVLSVGLDVTERDQNGMPDLSRGLILDYLKTNYVAIQARIHKDPLSGEQYLGAKPMAATAKFGPVRVTEEFQEAVLAAVRNLRSVGLWVPEKKPSYRPTELRTAVHLQRFDILEPGSSLENLKSRPEFEYVFVRGLPSRKNAGEIDLYAFTTAKQRTELHFLDRYDAPRGRNNCDIVAQVVFTEYKLANLYPSASVVRSTGVNSARKLSWEDAEAFARKNDADRTASQQLNLILDAMIRGDLR